MTMGDMDLEGLREIIGNLFMAQLKAAKKFPDPEEYVKELLFQVFSSATKSALEKAACLLLPSFISEALVKNTTKHLVDIYASICHAPVHSTECLADAISLKISCAYQIAGPWFLGSILGAVASWIVRVGFLVYDHLKKPSNGKRFSDELLKTTLEELICLFFCVTGKVLGAVCTNGNFFGMVVGGVAGNIVGRFLAKRIVKLILKIPKEKGGYKSAAFDNFVDECAHKILWQCRVTTRLWVWYAGSCCLACMLSSHFWAE